MRFNQIIIKVVRMLVAVVLEPELPDEVETPPQGTGQLVYSSQWSLQPKFVFEAHPDVSEMRKYLIDYRATNLTCYLKGSAW